MSGVAAKRLTERLQILHDHGSGLVATTYMMIKVRPEDEWSTCYAQPSRCIAAPNGVLKICLMLNIMIRRAVSVGS
jgi:hypothetical protein